MPKINVLFPDDVVLLIDREKEETGARNRPEVIRRIVGKHYEKDLRRE